VRALIYAPRGYSKYRRRLEEALRAAGVEWMALARSGGGGPTAADFLLVVGDDHAVLEAHGMLGLDVPPHSRVQPGWGWRFPGHRWY
jgi:hypothetical protein